MQDVHGQHAAFAGEGVDALRTAAWSLDERLFAFIILADDRAVVDTFFA